MVPTIFEILKDQKLRKYVSNRITANLSKGRYEFPVSFPILCRYTSFSNYSVEDILNGRITLTKIGEFNDIYDGIIHTNSKANDIECNYNILDCLGTLVCCFSEDTSSTLMWSHYAKYNTGICTSYDFNDLSESDPFKNLIFPVAYLNKPVEITDLFKADNECSYPVEANVLVSAICKYEVWRYEKEWRMIFIDSTSNREEKHLPLYFKTKPKEILFGSWFMKNFVCKEGRSSPQYKEAYEIAEQNIINAKNLFSYMVDNNISCSILKPQIGSFQLVPWKVNACSMLKFFNGQFKNNTPEDIRYINVIQKIFIDFLHEEENNV